jgi:hypothetical protein
MTDRRLRAALLAAVAVACISAAAAIAARPPTLQEREAIVNALPASVRNAPAECLWLDIRVSTRDSRYASVDGLPLNWEKPGSRCLRYANNAGLLILKKAPRWKIVFEGSDPPRCSLRVPRDLSPCLKG